MTTNEETAVGFDSREVLRRLIDSVADYAIFMLDSEGRIATWNNGAQRIKGYAASEIIGKHFSTFYPPEDVAKCDYELEQARAVGRFEDEGWRVRKDGSQFWANVVISAVRGEHGELIGYSKVTRDLTERRQAEEQRAARQAAEQANRAKDEFLAMLGHELRNPMAPILTALDLLRLRSECPSRELEIIERQVQYMNHLIEDLLDISRVTRGKLVLKRKRVDLRAVVTSAIEVASPLFEQRHHHLDIETPPEPIHVEGDEARLIQVFSNLLTNSAKYTDPGGHIKIRFRTVDGQAAVDIVDDGRGISADLLPRVFDLFIQGNQSNEREAGGLGLGLAVVRALVGLHHGAVEAHSAGPGHGSTFTVHLPIAEAAVEEAPAPRPRSTAFGHVGPPRRILLVDDNDDARELLVDALGSVGHEVRGAADPVEALELLQTFSPEIAVLDIGLPVMDGYELATRLRSAMSSSVPRMIALTGYGQPQDEARSAAAGFDVHLVKPVDVRRLLGQIASLTASLATAPLTAS